MSAACFLPGSARAQARPDPRAAARTHAGPFYVTPVLELQDLGVDTNVFNRRESISDFTFTFAPKVDIFVPMGRSRLTLSSATDFVYFQDVTSERSVNTDLSVRGDFVLRRITLFAENSYRNTRRRLNREVDARARRLENTVRGGVKIGLSPKTELELAGRFSLRQFDGDASLEGLNLARTLNGDSRVIEATVRYAATPLTTLVVRGERRYNRFDQADERETNTVRILPGIEFKPRALLSGFAYVGYENFKALDVSLPDFSGVVTSVGLSYRLLRATTLSFTTERDMSYSFGRNEPGYFQVGYGVSVSRQIGRDLELSAGAERRELQYRRLLTAPVPTVTRKGRVDTIRHDSVSLRYRLPSGSAIRLGVAYVQRTSSERLSRNYTGVRIGTTFIYGF